MHVFKSFSTLKFYKIQHSVDIFENFLQEYDIFGNWKFLTKLQIMTCEFR